jgi:hypothetical protein
MTTRAVSENWLTETCRGLTATLERLRADRQLEEAARARRLKVVAITDAGYLAQIHQTASLAQTARSPEAVADHVREQLIGLLDLQECRFEYGALPGHPPRLEPRWHGAGCRWPLGRGESGLPGEEVELRTFGNGQYYGGSCQRLSRARGRPCKHAWWPSPWPARQGARSPGNSPPAPGREGERCRA